ncbi:hypothetical protein MKW94_030527 [Papaver nudicaule]|uniref:WD repeat-containing protein 76 n=1 Tax=Papaver nudicaule TaxID=74823 RepID=A0AA41VNC6_PAPNU|nr:hypothetical protein [Papaver nudicaule]
MASQTLTDYERRRLENIKRNQEMMSSFKLQSVANELHSSTSKRQRTETKSYKTTRGKQPKSEAPIVMRRSLRARGIAPENQIGLEEEKNVISIQPENPSPRKLGPVRMLDAYKGTCTGSLDNQREHQKHLIDTIKGLSESNLMSCSSHNDTSSLNLGSLILKPENVARLLPKNILNLCFFPCKDRSIVVAGNKSGSLAIWDMDADLNDREEEEIGNEGIYLYDPHTAPISGIAIRPFSLSKIYTSSYDGCVRLMDVEKESFDMLYSSDDAIFCLSPHPHEAKSLYFGEAQGVMNVWDERAGKPSSSCTLHGQRINTIDFHLENTNYMATSSSDGTACIWDLRSINADQPEYLKMVDHKKAVHSAYFSPSGNCLATTSANDRVGLLRGIDFNDISMVQHNNQVGRWIPSFRAIWGWDDLYLFIGNMQRGVDVISTGYRKMVTLGSSYMSAIPCRFSVHPYKVGMLAGATAGGQVYTWISQQL